MKDSFGVQGNVAVETDQEAKLAPGALLAVNMSGGPGREP